MQQRRCLGCQYEAELAQVDQSSAQHYQRYYDRFADPFYRNLVTRYEALAQQHLERINNHCGRH